PDEIDDNTILELDPIGIICDAFSQILENLREKNKDLQSAYDKIEAILQSAPSGIVIIDTETFTIVDVNPTASEIIQLSREEIIGRNCCDFFCVESKHACPAMQNKGHVDKAERKIITANKEIKTLIKSVRPFLMHNKMMLIESFIDITEYKRMQEELVKAQRIESLSVFAGGIAHDFNNIITVILGNISLVSESIKDVNKNSYNMLKKAEWATQKAQGIAKQLLSFSKGGAPVLKTTSVIDLVRDTVSFILSGKDVVINFDIEDHIPLIEIDEGQVSQVFQNLAINALESMTKTKKLDISVKKVSALDRTKYPLIEGNYIKITFRDYGTGIPEGLIERMFEPFFTTKKHGSGLGLAIVYTIIKKHNGHIFAENHPEGGAEFKIFLPFFDKPDVRQDSVQKKHPQKNRILLMDDDEFVTDVIVAMIESLGYNCISVSNGEEAISVYQSAVDDNKPFDIVIMDMTIQGGMGGEETIRKLKEIAPQVKAILSSGYDIDNETLKELGFIGFIKKPFKIDDLKLILEQAIK
ncbi:MAG TPA: response regulator, partial [Nitrospirae bacterium]|nr:response regulator [Nitrospirota bacterium]